MEKIPGQVLTFFSSQRKSEASWLGARSNAKQSLQVGDLPRESWKYLPNLFFAALLDRLESVDARAARLVCKDWRVSVDTNLKRLKPRDWQARLLSFLSRLLNPASSVRSPCEDVLFARIRTPT